MRHHVVNGVTFSRQFCVDIAVHCAASVGLKWTKTNRAQAQVRVIHAEYSSTPQGIEVNAPGQVGIRVSYATLVKHKTSARWFQKSIVGRARKYALTV